MYYLPGLIVVHGKHQEACCGTVISKGFVVMVATGATRSFSCQMVSAAPAVEPEKPRHLHGEVDVRCPVLVSPASYAGDCAAVRAFLLRETATMIQTYPPGAFAWRIFICVCVFTQY